MIDNIIDSHKADFAKAIEHLHQELGVLRTGRANAALLSTVMVESYGSKLPLAQVASITVPDAKTLSISPWDKGQIQAIEKGVMTANLGFNPSNDGTVIRITLPPLSEERRKEMVKLLGGISEKSKISIRNVREDILKNIKRAEAEGHISKDDVGRAQKKVQDLVDDFNKQIKEITEVKEKEIMTV